MALGNLKTCEGFECTDGKKFINEHEAVMHQTRLDVIAVIKKSDFRLHSGMEAEEMCIGDLALILEMAKAIKAYEGIND